jgi:hypothetical protein
MALIPPSENRGRQRKSSEVSQTHFWTLIHNLAESELGVLTSQCLDRRIPDKATLIEEIDAWQHDRNASHTKADWQFTTKNARIKLKHLYPAI